MNKLREDSKYKTISEVAKILNIVTKKKGTLSTHTIRFWEKQFKQIKPKKFSGNRRYYDNETINMLRKIKYLLKDKGMTLYGVKKALNSGDSDIDEMINTSIKQKNMLKSKIKKIKDLLKDIKNHNG